MAPAAAASTGRVVGQQLAPAVVRLGEAERAANAKGGLLYSLRSGLRYPRLGWLLWGAKRGGRLWIYCEHSPQYWR